MNKPSPAKPKQERNNILSSPLRKNSRLALVFILAGITGIIILVRVFNLTFFSPVITGGSQTQKRGLIKDIENNVLALSEESYNLYYNPRENTLSSDEIRKLIQIIPNLNTAEVATKLKVSESIPKNQRRTFLLKRFTDKDTVNEIQKINTTLNIGFKGIQVDKIFQRIYPYDSLLSQTLGFVGYDGSPFYGIEDYYDGFLRYVPLEGYEKAIALNIKIEFQKKLEDLIIQSVRENNADYGSIIVQKINTGRIIGLANYPDFNPNNFVKYPTASFLNRANSFLVEPGSIFKIFFIAYLIEKFNPSLTEKKYHCKGYYELSNGEVIKCHDTHGDISIEDIIKYSCNSGIIEATEDLTPEEMFNFMRRFAIGDSHGIDLPSESKGLILNQKDWGVRTKATIPLGQGLALTPLHLINIFSALIGNGYLYQPKIARYLEEYENGKLLNRKEIQPEIINKIISEEVSKKIVSLLHYGTIKGSTGYSSRNTGFEQVFGKTATSQLANLSSGGYYTNRYHSMFAGGYPLNNPQYAVLVVVSQPSKEYYGGKVAAPIFANVIEALNKHYNLTAERNVESYRNLILEENVNDEYVEENLVDQVPNLIGLSIRKAVALMEDFKKVQTERNIKVTYKLSGSGFVAKQSPAPGTQVKDQVNFKLIFR